MKRTNRLGERGFRRARAFGLSALGLLAAGTAFAEQPSQGEERSPWRGSVITYENVVSGRSLDKSADLTYNPYYAMSLTLEPRFWFTDTAYVRGSIDVSHELTEADDNTEKNETVLGDARLGVGASLWTLPVVDIKTAVSLDFKLPTSKVSQARTLVVGAAPGLSFSRSFDVLAGAQLSYGLRFERFFHNYTTSELDSPAISGCEGSIRSCDSFLNTGVRNAKWRTSHTVSAALSPVSWATVSTSVSAIQDRLYPGADGSDLEGIGDNVFVPMEPTDSRELMSYNIELEVAPVDSFAVGLGVMTTNPQLAPDSTYYAPFFNQYTSYYLDLRLDVGSLVAGNPRS